MEAGVMFQLIFDGGYYHARCCAWKSLGCRLGGQDSHSAWRLVLCSSTSPMGNFTMLACSSPIGQAGGRLHYCLYYRSGVATACLRAMTPCEATAAHPWFFLETYSTPHTGCVIP